ncbi:hypothetical protein HN587_00165 [Candidatus Woesearchaeota archaeon]|jgi:hypothetical protein|nr:hypothetical protein [Candidatus Woesearchaeota archaeon]
MAQNELNKEEIEQEMDTGKREADVYDNEGLEKLREDDEIQTWEQGFSEGANEGGHLGKCANCGTIINNLDTVIEEELNGEKIWCCSDACATKYKEKKSSETSTEE